MRYADWLLVLMLCPVRRNVEYFLLRTKKSIKLKNVINYVGMQDYYDDKTEKLNYLRNSTEYSSKALVLSRTKAIKKQS